MAKFSTFQIPRSYDFVDTPRYTSSGEIPVYSHPVFKATFGQQAATGISRSINPYTKGLKDEIRLIIEKNINRPEMLTTENVLSTLMQHEGRAKSTSQIDIGLVDKLMDEIENDIISEENAQMTGEKLNDSPLAFPDMQSAVTEAQMKFSQDVVVQDPVSKVMHGQPNPKIVSTFTIPRNFTEQDLKRMRQIKEAKERGEVVDEFPIVEQEPEIREEIGIQEPEVIGPDGKTLKTPKNANPQLGTVPENQLLEQQRELELASSHTRKIIVATLKSLIKIADEMDNEGKDDAAEEIHKVIRKYQERI